MTVSMGRPRKAKIAAIDLFKTFAASAVIDLRSRGIHPTPRRILNAVEARHRDVVSQLKHLYATDTLYGFARQARSTVASDDGGPPIRTKTRTWLRARLAQRGRLDIFDAVDVDSLIARARRDPHANFTPEETVVLSILAEREVVPVGVLGSTFAEVQETQTALLETW